MENLVTKVENKNGILVVSSRVISEELSKRHSDVIKQIESILTNENTRSLIISSSYVDLKGERRKEYLLTEKGFTLYMFNIQGHNEFKLAYINEFERMKEILNNKPLTVEEMIIAQAQSVLEVKNDIKRLESKFDTVVTLESGKQRKIQLAVASRVYSIIDSDVSQMIKTDSLHQSGIHSGEDLEGYKKQCKKILFGNIYRDIKRKFGVASYKDIKVVEYEKALNFIENWIEDKEVI